jgi:hypothetical protein
MGAGHAFCSVCGQAAPSAAAVPGAGAMGLSPAEMRFAGHIDLLSIFWIILCFLWLFPAGFLLAMGAIAGRVMPFCGRHVLVLRILGPFVLSSLGCFFALMAALCFFVGWGLRQRRSWARVLAIVLGVLSLFHPPIGTALGVYTLWVLVGNNANLLYDRMAIGGFQI